MIIYKTINLINGKIYIGKDVKNDPEYLGSGVILEKAIKKYGKENFKKETIETCFSLSELDKREVFWIKELNATDRRVGYNIALGGTGGDTFSKQTDKRKKEIIELTKSKTKSYHESEHFRKRQSEISKKMWENDAHRKLITEIMTGREIPWANKISQSVSEHWKTRDRTVSEEQRKKISLASKGRILKPITEEQQNKIIELYQTIGPKLIEKQIGVSRYIITNFLKRKGLYQKWQKGIGEKSQKHASILMLKNVRGKKHKTTT